MQLRCKLKAGTESRERGRTESEKGKKVLARLIFYFILSPVGKPRRINPATRDEQKNASATRTALS